MFTRASWRASEVCNGPGPLQIGQRVFTDFWEGDATKHFSLKKGFFSEKGRGKSVNEGFGTDFYRKGDSVKRSGPSSELQDSEN